MKIKIVEVIGNEYPSLSYDDYSVLYHLKDTMEWEDVNEEELDALTVWVKEYNKTNYPNKVVLITEKALDYRKTIKDYLEKAVKVKEEVEEREKIRLKKEAERIAKNKEAEEKRRLKKLEKKRKLLDELKIELGEK